MNSINVIQPYRYKGMWVFDDDSVGLLREPFVSGSDIILDVLTKDIPNAREGCTLVFSATPFPGHTASFLWSRQDQGGNWYYVPEAKMEGWLCPALLKYFKEAPKAIYVQFKELKEPRTQPERCGRCGHERTLHHNGCGCCSAATVSSGMAGYIVCECSGFKKELKGE